MWQNEEIKYLVLDGDLNGEGEIFTFTGAEFEKATRCFRTHPNSVMYQLIMKQKITPEPSPGHFQIY